MTSDTVDRYYGQAHPGMGNPVLSVFRWLIRYIGTTGLMLSWAIIVLLFAAVLTPGKHSKGLALELGLNQLLGAVTIVYYLAVLPLLMIPTKDDEQFTWFVVTALGWIGCLLGTVLFLRAGNHLAITAIPSPQLAVRIGTVGGIVVLGLIVCLVWNVNSQRKLFAGIVLAVVGGLLCMAMALDSGKKMSGWLERLLGLASEPFLELLMVASFALAVVFFVWTFLLPERRDDSTQAFGLLLLLLGFGLASLLCWGLLSNRVAMRSIPGGHEFRCLAATAVAAPFISWLGMPWNKGSRFFWIAGFVLAAYLTNFVFDDYLFTGNRTVVEQMWTQYDGQHLTPHLTTQ